MKNIETQQFIEQHINDNPVNLALRKHSEKVDMRYALSQIASFQYIRIKIPSWSTDYRLILPPHLSLEQASSEMTAKYKSAVVLPHLEKRERMIDLTGGMGIDTFFLAKSFERTTYVEQNSELAEIAAHNFGLMDCNIDVVNGDSELYINTIVEDFDFIFIDPARRGTKGQKVFSIADCTPNLLGLQKQLLAKAPTVLIKLSPMLDITLAMQQLDNIAEIHVVSVANECKELLFLLKRGYSDTPTVTAVNLGSESLTATLENESATPLRTTSEVGKYIYEPYTSVLKAGFFKILTERFPVLKLHINSHLYTSDDLIAEFPGRKFAVDRVIPFNNKAARELGLLRNANITVRNFPLSPDQLRKKLKLGDGGNHYIFATTITQNDKILILCYRP